MSADQLSKCIHMMRYLHLMYFTIPHHGLALPTEVLVDGFRPDKVFQLCTDGRMKYTGMGFQATVKPFGWRNPKFIYDIPLPKEWEERTYQFLRDEVIDHLDKNVRRQNCRIKDIKRVILRFEKMSWIYD